LKKYRRTYYVNMVSEYFKEY